MEFGLFTCGYQRRSLEQAFADAVSFGYDYIELWGGRPHAYAPDLVMGAAEGIRCLSEKYCLPVRVYTPEHNAWHSLVWTSVRCSMVDSASELIISSLPQVCVLPRSSTTALTQPTMT